MARELTWSEGNRLVGETGREDYLAVRITEERERRGWSQSELSRRLSDIGANIHQTAISKIEKPQEERRAITVDEAIAFAKVFEVPLGELLLPPDTVASVEMARFLDTGLEYLREIEKATDRYHQLITRMGTAAADDEAIAQRMRDRLAWIAERNAGAPADSEPAPMERVLLDALRCRDEIVAGRRPRRRR